MNQPRYPGIRNAIPSDLLKLTFAAPLRLKTPIITAVTINAYINGTTTLLKYLTIGANCYLFIDGVRDPPRATAAYANCWRLAFQKKLGHPPR
jgi:hypothetical protein